MAEIKQTRFTAWTLSVFEQKAGAVLNDLQIKVIQNLISNAAEEKVALTYDPQNPLQFAQREAELQGQIGILEFLLSQSQEIANTNQSGE